MEAKYGCRRLTGLEIQPESADMAMRSVELNGLSDRVRFLCRDVFELLPELEGAGETFDVVKTDFPAPCHFSSQTWKI